MEDMGRVLGSVFAGMAAHLDERQRRLLLRPPGASTGRLSAVTRADPEAYLKLSRQRDSRVRLRVRIALLALLAALAVLAVALGGPPLPRLAAAVLAITVCGIVGAPADRPMLDRAVVPARVEKLTSEIVIRALGALGVAAINQAVARNPHGGIEFKAPITRDGPGWRRDTVQFARLRGAGRSRQRFLDRLLKIRQGAIGRRRPTRS